MNDDLIRFTLAVDPKSLTVMIGWSNQQLVNACLDGNRQAWSALIDRYKHLIFSIPIKYGLSRRAGNDVFQHVSLRLLFELPALIDVSYLSTWLINVTFEYCREWIRLYGMSENVALDYANANAELPLSSATDNEYQFHLQREQILREELLRTSPRCRELHQILFYKSGVMPSTEVAKDSLNPEGQRDWRNRCLKHLRGRLIDRGF